MEEQNKIEQPKIKLKPKYRKFVENYLKHFNKTKAALESGCCKSEASAATIGNRLFKKVEIETEIDRQLKESLKETKLSLERRVIDETEILAYSDITNPHPRAIQSMKYMVIEDENGQPKRVPKEIKLHSKTPALKMMLEYAGLLKQEGVNVNINNQLIAVLPEIDPEPVRPEKNVTPDENI